MEPGNGSPARAPVHRTSAAERSASSKLVRKASSIASIMSVNVSNARARLGSASSSSSRASAGRSGVEGGDSDAVLTTPLRNVVRPAKGGRRRCPGRTLEKDNAKRKNRNRETCRRTSRLP